MIYEWIGETLLGTACPAVVREVGFLQREEAATGDRAGREDVGRIDEVLVHPSTEPLRWCALEKQAVYFSGDNMSREFEALAGPTVAGLLLPVGRRRPDYRSSRPKRLMPQLQTKVPTLRRWGRKTAVVVDEQFFGSLGRMDDVQDVSSCDIAWFVVGYAEAEREAHLRPSFVRFTTLERAVEGLTAGRPVSLQVFEERIRAKLRGPSTL